MTPEIVDSISDRYIELYEQITGDKFIKNEQDNILNRVEQNVLTSLTALLSN